MRSTSDVAELVRVEEDGTGLTVHMSKPHAQLELVAAAGEAEQESRDAVAPEHGPRDGAANLAASVAVEGHVRSEQLGERLGVVRRGGREETLGKPVALLV